MIAFGYHDCKKSFSFRRLARMAHKFAPFVHDHVRVESFSFPRIPQGVSEVCLPHPIPRDTFSSNWKTYLSWEVLVRCSGGCVLFSLEVVESDMFSFVFNRRIAPLPVLTSLRASHRPSIRPFRAVVTRELTKQNLRPTTLSSAVQVRKASSDVASKFPTLFQGLKVFFIGSGIWFWCRVCYELYTRRGRQQREFVIAAAIRSLYRNAAIFQFDPKVFLQQGNDDNKNELSKELEAKRKAVESLWEKLRSEEDFLRKFGENVNVTGFKVQFPNKSEEPNSEDPVISKEEKDEVATGRVTDNGSNSGTWELSLYIDGSKSSGLVTMKFQRVKNKEILWVPVDLQVNAFPNSGVEICHLSSPLPNGLANFTRLFSYQ